MPNDAVQTNLPLTFECSDCGDTLACDDATQCDNCERCHDRSIGRDCCRCYTCDGCDARTNPDDNGQCSNCDQCDDCCECHTCEGCDTLTSAVLCSTCEHCNDCCQCWRCRGCRDMIDPNSDEGYRCDNCDYCASCCGCESCERCGERFSELCQRCNEGLCCDNCCQCEEEADNDEEAVSTRVTRGYSRPYGVFTDGALVFHNAVTFDLNRSRRHASLEIEVARDNGDSQHHVRPTAERWHDAIVRDGSLPTGGYEINLNPTNGDLLLKHVSEVCASLKASGAVVDKSCGMHCHIDARDLTTDQLLNLCHIYSRVEDAMFSVVSRSRRKQSDDGYCRKVEGRYRFKTLARFISDLESALYPYCGDVAAEKRKKYSQARYYALNLHSFFLRQTVEFRHHQGTTNPMKAANWAMLCIALVDAAASMTADEVEALPLNSWECLMTLLPNDVLREYCAKRRDMLA